VSEGPREEGAKQRLFLGDACDADELLIDRHARAHTHVHTRTFILKLSGGGSPHGWTAPERQGEEEQAQAGRPRPPSEYGNRVVLAVWVRYQGWYIDIESNRPTRIELVDHAATTRVSNGLRQCRTPPCRSSNQPPSLLHHHHHRTKQTNTQNTHSSRAAVLEAAERAATRRAQEALLQALVETGGKDQLLVHLRERLHDAGWLDQVKEHIKGACVVGRHGVQQL
jgi:hypothetical protein